MRPSTEWVDTVELGANTLVDDDPDRIVAAAQSARMPEHRPDLYGDGRAAEVIADLLYTLS
jgi:UDP-N-acetylglucosamine 2-epimerase